VEKEVSKSELVEFLCAAKHTTYASGGSGSQASVNAVLGDSHQLEYRSGELFYRDIYFGEAFFAGQESVYFKDNAIWSMCYAGGWMDPAIAPAQTGMFGGFLQAALKLVPENHPYRGPLEFRDGELLYSNRPNGSISRFKGVEQILSRNVLVYELNYVGGLLR
jgi:hypothetical protein